MHVSMHAHVQLLHNYGKVNSNTDEPSLLVEAGVPYNVTVKAVNLAGCGKEMNIYCFTQERGIYDI